jgi:hypothetical protein
MNGGFGTIMGTIALSVSILAVQCQGSDRSLGMCLRRSNVDGLMADLTDNRIKHMYIIYISFSKTFPHSPKKISTLVMEAQYMRANAN